MQKSARIRVAGYVRVSTEDQVDSGLGIEVQCERIEAYAKSQGWDLVEIFQDDGQSGKTIDRPALKRLLKVVEDRAVEIVLVYKLDRLSRRQRDVWTIIDDHLEPAGVGFKSVTEPFETTTAQGKAFLGMLAVFAQLERDTIIERTKVAMAQKQINGEHCGRAPFGYRIQGKQLVKYEPEQKLIRKARHLRRKGLSFVQLSEQIGVPPSTLHGVLSRSKKRGKSKPHKALRG